MPDFPHEIDTISPSGKEIETDRVPIGSFMSWDHHIDHVGEEATQRDPLMGGETGHRSIPSRLTPRIASTLSCRSRRACVRAPVSWAAWCRVSSDRRWTSSEIA